MRLVVATGNKGKLAEIGEVLADADVTLISQRELASATPMKPVPPSRTRSSRPAMRAP